MRILFLSAAVGFITGVITFFLSLAFLCIVLLILGAVSHTRPDMTLTFKAAVPVAILGVVSGFAVTLVRSIRAAMAHNR